MRLRKEMLGGMAIMAMGISAQAETLTDFFQQSKVDGQIRSYYFSRLYGTPAIPNQNAFALGGILNVRTAPFLGGLGLGVSFFTANSLGTHGADLATTDPTLMGLNPAINALGQAYVQFQQPWILVRAGDQIINTPWMQSADARMLPATYQGLYLDVTPVRNLHFYGVRVFRWKSRTSSDYYKDNLYYQTGYDGDPLYGGLATIPNTEPQANGTLAFGSSYALGGAKVQAWYYDFYRFANMFYGDASYTLKTSSGFSPFIGAQYVREWLGNNAFSQFNAPLLGYNGSVDSTAYGIRVGLNFPGGNLSWAYNAISPHAGSVGDGSIISPYTVGYAFDPLYTTSMTRGLVELGPGDAWKVKATYNAFGKAVLIMAAFARYHTYLHGSGNDTYLDITYFPKGSLKGLSIRDRVEVNNGGQYLAPNNRSFIYNRVMLTYQF